MNDTTKPKLVRFDWAMKKLLRDKVNFDILEGFLSELLKEQITIERLLESESNQETQENKFNRVDLLVNTKSGEKIIIEVQTASEWDFYHRILFGTSKVITEYIDKGDPYSKVPKVISVSILFFNLGVGSDYVYKGVTEFTGIHNNDKLQLTGDSIELYLNELNKDYNILEQIQAPWTHACGRRQATTLTNSQQEAWQQTWGLNMKEYSPSDVFPTYYIIQLKKFADKIKDKFDEWVYLLKNESIKPEFDAQGIKSAKEKLDVLKLPEDKRKEYEKYWLDLSFEASLIETHQVQLAQAERFGEAKGEAKGLAKGRLEEKLEMVRSMLSEKADINFVAKISGLSLEEIYKIQQTLEI